MRKVFKAIVVGLIWLWSKIYNINTIQWFKKKRITLYTVWISNFLGKVGEDTSIYYPCHIKGGGGKSIKIGKNTIIQANCILGCHIKYGGYSYEPEISIGDNCNLGEHNHITAINRISIGNGVLTVQYVYIGDNSHGSLSMEESSIPPAFRKLVSKGEVVIEDNVWVGDKVAILSGVRIGEGSVIGANSVVTKDVPPFCIVGGCPARIIRKL